MNFFSIKHTDGRARAGVITTAHGQIETPTFMPVGTQASVKSLDQQDLASLGAQIILGNTYHLHLRPGEDLIAEMGGLHKFMNWSKPILTDSGGYQVFSLGLQKGHKNLVEISEDGVIFSSHLDGSKHTFTPESAIETQHKLGADIIMAFDECAPDDIEKKYSKEAMERTHRWAERSLKAHQKFKGDTDRYLFGIIQGGNHEDLRKESATFISNLDFDGIAVGGESVGYNMDATKQILDWVYPIIPEGKPHYAMGLGLSPLDIFAVVERGVDVFDCVGPTRLARHGMLYIKDKSQNYRLNLTNADCRKDSRPIDPNCQCSTCQHYSRAYLHHLFKAEELSAYRLATIHNLAFFLDLLKQIRNAIKEGRFDELKREWN